LLTLTASWKFQTLPVIGLVLICLGKWKGFWKYPAWVMGSLAFWFFLPFVFVDRGYLTKQVFDWQRSLREFMPNAWMAPIFHHVYGFFSKTTGVPIDFSTAQRISAAVGIGFAGFLANLFYRHHLPAHLAFTFAFGLGSAFTVLFSPLSQGTGFLLVLPLVLLVVCHGRFCKRSEWEIGGVLVVGYYFTSLCVSDLTPLALRLWFYGHGFKALGALIFLGAVLAWEFARVRGRWGLKLHRPVSSAASTRL
jgi:hypothetical protein